jgi:hypothetical protein
LPHRCSPARERRDQPSRSVAVCAWESDRTVVCVRVLACELGDRAPASDAVSDDVIVQLLVFLGRPEPLAELGLHAGAGEPSHSDPPNYSDDGRDKKERRSFAMAIALRSPRLMARLLNVWPSWYIWGSVRTKKYTRTHSAQQRAKSCGEAAIKWVLSKVQSCATEGAQWIGA